MSTIFHKVRGVEKKAMRLSNAAGSSKDVAMQALLFTISYAIPWIWAPIKAGIDTADIIFTNPNADDAVIALSIVNVIIFPLQGFFNFLVYLRPRYGQVRTWMANARVVVAVRNCLKMKKSSSGKQEGNFTSSFEGKQTDVEMKENNNEMVSDVAGAESEL
eukprot:scaffold6280_cov79-Skeletonema_dohrnii-CCMP3373.AAC.2